MEYAFTNWTQVPFTGRYDGVDYLFAVGEKKPFDPDKHQMLIIMAKQLADRELLKGIAGVGRNPNEVEKFGKALDKEGNLFDMKVGDRKDYMRKAIGVLADTPLPVPADQAPDAEAGTTAGLGELKDQVAHLTELVQSLAAAKGGSEDVVAVAPPEPPTPATELPAPETPTVAEPRPTETGPVPPVAAEQGSVDGKPNMGMTREILMEMAQEAGLNPNPEITKEQLVELLNPTPPNTA